MRESSLTTVRWLSYSELIEWLYDMALKWVGLAGVTAQHAVHVREVVNMEHMQQFEKIHNLVAAWHCMVPHAHRVRVEDATPLMFSPTQWCRLRQQLPAQWLRRDDPWLLE
jgi:hypothetical protein